MESYGETEAGLILEVEADSDSATCPRCGTLSHHLHQNHGYLVRNRPIEQAPDSQSLTKNVIAAHQLTG